MASRKPKLKETVRRDTAETALHWVVSVVHSPGLNAPKLYRVDDPSVPIGRDDSNPSAIVLDDPAVSGDSVRLKRMASAAYELVDAGSTNAVRVGGRRVRANTELADNDVIRLGDSLLVIERHDVARGRSNATAEDDPLLEALCMYASTARAILQVEQRFFESESLCVAVRADGFTEMRLMADWLGEAWGLETRRIDATDASAIDATVTTPPDAALVIERLDAAPSSTLPALVNAIEERVLGDRPGRLAFTYSNAEPRSLVDGLLQTVVDTKFAVPPLTERRSDILPAIRKQVAERAGIAQVELPAICAEKLLCYGWPGGVGELRRVARRLARRLESEGSIDRLALPAEIRAVEVEPDSSQQNDITPESFEEIFLEFRGNLREVAEHYGYARTYLYRLLRQKGIDVSALRRKHDL